MRWRAVVGRTRDTCAHRTRWGGALCVVVCCCVKSSQAVCASTDSDGCGRQTRANGTDVRMNGYGCRGRVDRWCWPCPSDGHANLVCILFHVAQPHSLANTRDSRRFSCDPRLVVTYEDVAAQLLPEIACVTESEIKPMTATSMKTPAHTSTHLYEHIELQVIWLP